MKILAWLGAVLVSLVLVVYGVAFTSFGNSIVAPIIQEKINESTKLDAKLSTFSLSMSDFEIILDLTPSNQVHIKGTYSPFAQSFDVDYKVKMDNLGELQELAGVKIAGVFHTDGKVKGDTAFVVVDGKSDVASSATSYHVELTEFNPTSIIAKVESLKLEELLYIGGQKQFAHAKLNLDVNFKNIKVHELDGDIKLVTKDGVLNSKLMKKEFKLNIPKTLFSMNLDAKLNGDLIKYAYELTSNLATVTTSGEVNPEPLNTNIIYALNVKELAVLKPITGADLRGPLRVNGEVKGSKQEMIVTAKSDIASSKTSAKIILKDFAPDRVKAKIANMHLAKVLYMVKQPKYTDGVFSLDVDITNAKMGELQGSVNSQITKGLLNSAYITKLAEFKTHMPRTTYNLKTKTTLNKDIVDTKVDLDSTLAKLNIKQARFNIKDASLVSDYTTTIPNLNKLYFATDRHLKGAITANGELKKDKNLEFTAHSKIADGKLDARLFNNDFTADLKGVQTLKVLDMLIYPKVFKSTLDGKVIYDLAQAKGKFDGKLNNGKFTKNEAFGLLKQYAGVDLYVETFKGDVNALINKEKIVASVNLTSNTSAIKTKNTKLNTKTKKIDSTVEVVANKQPIVFTLKGDIASPKVGIDLQKFMKSKVGKELEDKAQKEVGNLLKGLF